MLSTERAITAITGLPETLVVYTAGITVWVVFTRFWVIWVAGQHLQHNALAHAGCASNPAS